MATAICHGRNVAIFRDASEARPLLVRLQTASPTSSAAKRSERSQKVWFPELKRLEWRTIRADQIIARDA
jgi:hypothetical protein